MLPDDDKQYAIETWRSSESVLKKWFKNKLHTISAFVGFVIIITEYLYWQSWMYKQRNILHVTGTICKDLLHQLFSFGIFQA